MNSTARSLRPLIAWIVVLLLLAGLHATQAVTMPLGLACFGVTLAWPLQSRFERKFPRGVSLVITILALLLVFGLFVGSLVLCGNTIADRAPDYEQRFDRVFEQFKNWTQREDLPIRLNQIDPKQMMDRAIDFFSSFAKGLYEFFGVLLLVSALVVLALLEVDPFRAKLQRLDHPVAGQLLQASSEVAYTLQRFVLTRTLTSTIVGLLSGFFALAIGLDMALVWGLISFFLNYIPVLGAVIAVIPPTLVALLQPQAIWLAPTALVGLGAIHFVVGNYIDPRLQGRFLYLSPFVLFYAIAFWGWVWGIAGAVLGVPMTIGVVIACRHFESTRWVAVLLSREEKSRHGPPVRAPEVVEG